MADAAAYDALCEAKGAEPFGEMRQFILSPPASGACDLRRDHRRLSDLDLAIFCDVLRTSTARLRHIHLGSNALTELGALELLALVRHGHQSALQCVIAFDNRLGPAGARAFGEMLRLPGINLTDLDLSGNAIGDNGAVEMASGVSRSKTLRRLNLSMNGIGDEGGVDIAKAIGACHSLLAVSLAANSFGPWTVQALARSLPPSLTNLDISGNNASLAVRQLITAVASRKVPLRRLRLRGTNLDDSAARAVADLLVGSSGSLAFVDLGNNPLGEGGVRSVLDAMLVQESAVVDLRLDSVFALPVRPTSGVVGACCSILRQHAGLRYLSLPFAVEGLRKVAPDLAESRKEELLKKLLASISANFQLKGLSLRHLGFHSHDLPPPLHEQGLPETLVLDKYAQWGLSHEEALNATLRANKALATDLEVWAAD